jgi:porphobilinogen deaminase
MNEKEGFEDLAFIIHAREKEGLRSVCQVQGDLLCHGICERRCIADLEYGCSVDVGAYTSYSS